MIAGAAEHFAREHGVRPAGLRMCAGNDPDGVCVSAGDALPVWFLT